MKLHRNAATTVAMLFCLSAGCSRKTTTTPLPHNEYYATIDANEAINSLRKDPKKDVIFAISKGFWGDDSKFDSIYAAYETFFEQKQAAIAAVLGEPIFAGHWMQDSFPVFAIGERVAVWGSGEGTIYLRIHHEDREVGIEVSLLTPLSPNSNHESKSIYDEMRKDIRAQQHP